jgi:putative sigma-54 modulation protein
MELQIAGTNIAITPETQRYVERKLGKLNRHKPDIIDIKVEISEESTKSPQARYLVRATIQSGGGATLHGEERAESVFMAIDKVVDIMTRQLERRKGKIYDKGRGNKLARGRYVQPEPPPAGGKVVKRKRFAVEPVTLEEAIEQMESLGHNFFLFVDAVSKETRLLYRRNDGNYGLIEPEFRPSRD